MRDVQRHRLLTPQEEHDAAVKYYEQGDLDAAAKLVTANLRLVVKIAYEYRRAHKHIPDLIQEGSIGLMQAVKKYDPYKGVKLSTYAAWWIRAYILRFILNNARLVKLGTTQAQRKLFFNLKKERARLSAMGIEPTPETIAKRLNVPAEDVVQMERRLSAGDMSLDSPLRSARRRRADAGSRCWPRHSGPVDEALADARGELACARQDPRVRRDADGQGRAHLQLAHARRRAAHAAGARRRVRRQPRARAPAREAAAGQAQGVPRQRSSAKACSGADLDAPEQARATWRARRARGSRSSPRRSATSTTSRCARSSTLRAAQLILAEDTRQTRKLLTPPRHLRRAARVPRALERTCDRALPARARRRQAPRARDRRRHAADQRPGRASGRGRARARHAGREHPGRERGDGRAQRVRRRVRCVSLRRLRAAQRRQARSLARAHRARRGRERVLRVARTRSRPRSPSSPSACTRNACWRCAAS